jgi:hypothetical protein
MDANSQPRGATEVNKTIIACVATALLVGSGTAVADSLITGADIKNRSIEGRDIATGAITQENVKNESLGSQDLRNGHVLSADIKNGGVRAVDLADSLRAQLAERAAGPGGTAGPQGPKGERGPAGRDGVSGYESIGPALAPWKVDTDPGNRQTGFHDIQVNCPAGKVAVSGGLETTNNAMMPYVTVHGTHPSAVDPVDPAGRIWHAKAWEVEFSIHSQAPEPAAVQAFVICQKADANLPG